MKRGTMPSRFFESNDRSAKAARICGTRLSPSAARQGRGTLICPVDRAGCSLCLNHGFFRVSSARGRNAGSSTRIFRKRVINASVSSLSWQAGRNNFRREAHQALAVLRDIFGGRAKLACQSCHSWPDGKEPAMVTISRRRGIPVRPSKSEEPDTIS